MSAGVSAAWRNNDQPYHFRFKTWCRINSADIAIPSHSWAISPSREYAISGGRRIAMEQSTAILKAGRLLLLNKTALSQPIGHGFPGLVLPVLGSLSPDSQPAQQLGIRDQLRNIALTASKGAALMGAEWNHCFSRKIIAFQKGEHSHGHGPPPVGVANENCVVGVHILHGGRQFRPCVIILLLPGLGNQIVIFLRVDRSSLHME